MSLRVWGAAMGAVFFTATVAPSFAADANRGKELFLACAACHTERPDALGPSLKGVVGREAASRDDFRYSPAMTRSNIVWDQKTLYEYLMNPQGTVQGNRMPFSGFTAAADADDVIAYLETLK